MRAALAVFVAAATFLGAVQFGGLHVDSTPRAPRPLELTIVASQAGRPAATAIHSEVPQRVESGRVFDYRNAGGPR